jgi:glyoxylase-like metal-dependent hydrolase (beta-lactamase superfamily II)
MNLFTIERARLAGAIAILHFVAVSVAIAQQPTNPDGPMVRAGAMTKISEHVHVIPDNGVGGVPNVGFIVGNKATLVIDTGMGKRNGEIVVNEARKLSGSNALYLVTTHVHPEHDLGAHAFPASTKMIRSRAQVNEIAEFGYQMADAFRKRSEAMRSLLEGAQFRSADVTFDDSYELDLGGVRVKILAVGPNHTPGDTVAIVEQDGVLFSGDVAMKALPAFASAKSSLDHWLKSLDQLDALKPRIVVPSHGPLGDAGFIANYREYLTVVRDKTAALKAQNKSLEEATQTVIAELKQQYPETGRINGAVRTAYTEAK